MKQSRLMSILETVLSTAIGFAVALLTQLAVFPWLGFDPPLSTNLLITVIFTIVSILRQFFVRRLFEALHIRRPLSPFMQAVIAERYRQIEQEGWSQEHDDEHLAHELAQAGITYIECAPCPPAKPPQIWPWTDQWWKPVGYRRDLVKGCALVIAEGEKFDRARKLKKRSNITPLPTLAHGKTHSQQGGSSA